MSDEKWQELYSMIEELKCVEKSLIIDNNKKSFLTSQKYKCQLNNGKIIIREKLLKGGLNGSASIIVPITKTNKVLLIVEPRVFTKDTIGIGFPAGYIEEDENAIDGCQRELLEETGYVADKIYQMDEFYQDEGCSEALNKTFIAFGCEKQCEQHLDPSEFVRLFECTFNDVLELEKLGYIKGANSKLAIGTAKKYLKRRS